METNSALSGGGIGMGILFIIGAIYKAVNHHRVRSKCCGKILEASLDVEETTPPNKELSIKVPPVPEQKV
jgi:hypothetical protein